MKSLPIPESLKPGNLVPDWTPGKVFKVTFALVLLFLLAVSSGKLFEQVDADDTVVIQSPIAGTLTWYTTPGLKWQGWGTVTRHRKSFTHWFSYRPEQAARHDQSIKTRFYDGGHAKISGSVRVDLPLDEKTLTALHIRFGSHDAILSGDLLLEQGFQDDRTGARLCAFLYPLHGFGQSALETTSGFFSSSPM